MHSSRKSLSKLTSISKYALHLLIFATSSGAIEGEPSSTYFAESKTEIATVLSASLINEKKQIAVLNTNLTVGLYDAETLELLNTFTSPKPEPILKLVLAPQSDEFAYGIANKAYLFNLLTGELLFETTESFDIDRNLQISEDGNRLLLHDLPVLRPSSQHTRTKIYDTRTNTLVFDQSFSYIEYKKLFLSPNGEKLTIFTSVTDIVFPDEEFFGLRYEIIAYKLLQYDLDQNALISETTLDMDPATLKLHHQAAVINSTSSGDSIVTMSTKDWYTLGNGPKEVTLKSYSTLTGALEFTTNLIINGSSDSLTRFISVSNNQIIVGDSSTGDQYFINPSTGEPTKAIDTMPINVPFESPQLAIQGNVEYIDSNTFISLGNDGKLLKWQQAEGTPVKATLSIDDENLICEIDTKPNSEYRILKGNNMLNMLLAPESTTSEGQQTIIKLPLPNDEPVFIKAIEIKNGDN